MTPIHTPIHTLDLGFENIPEGIAAYLIPHQGGAVLIECGPGSTQHNLDARVQALGYSLDDITDLFLTHIHLDHAGAAGWMARHGARVHVHPRGAPHLERPEKLLASAARIYGDAMDRLWGEFLPVPVEQLHAVEDNEVIEVGELSLRALDTPGHANHHLVYLFEDCAFSGDVAGMRMYGHPHLRLPTPPPEFHLERWRESLARLRREPIERIAPTHFGIYSDVRHHLDAVGAELEAIEAWCEEIFSDPPARDELHRRYFAWARQRSLAAGAKPEWIQAYETSAPSFMSADGLLRYWQKYRGTDQGHLSGG